MRIRALSCLNCGGHARLEHGEKQAACARCGAVIHLPDAVLREQAAGRAFPHTTPIRLGMKAQYRGKEWEATGRQVLRQRDEEDYSQWEEWVLIAEDGDLLYLEYDEGKWKLSAPFLPKEPLGPNELLHAGVGQPLRFDEHRALVTDAGHYQVAHAEGEFPWLVVPGRQLAYRDAAVGANFYCVEWTEEEIEYYRGEFLNERQVFAMFNLRQELAALERNEAVHRSRRNFGLVCIGAAVLALCWWISALTGGQVVRSGVLEVPVATAPTPADDEGKRFGPIRLTAQNRVHRLRISASLREQSAWVAAGLEDEDERSLFEVQRDMWDESGRDSDGYWHESDVQASTDFVLKRPGNYYIRMYTEPDPGGSGAPIRASYVLEEKALAPLFPALFGFAALVLGVVFLVAGSPSAVASMKASAASSDD